MFAPAKRVLWPVIVAVALIASSATANAAAPQVCGGVPQITDATGDGHHSTTDVTKAWFAEEPGALRAVIQVYFGNWMTDHADDGSDGAGFAMIYTVGGERRYARIFAPVSGVITYDYGVWTGGGGFVSQGTTTGSVTYGTAGWGTIDLPPIPYGTVIGQPFVLTWDGSESGSPHWVDRAPGGTAADDGGFGADFTVGTCVPGALGGDTGVLATQVSARESITGSKKVAITGKVVPALAGVPVSVRLQARKNRTLTTVTAADGSFRISPTIGETSTVTATAGGRTSGSIVVTVKSKTRIKLRRARGGSVVVHGTTNPALPGTVLLLRDGDYRSTAKAKAGGGRFTIRLRRPRSGRYEAVFIPSNGRAERSTSNKGIIR